MQRALAIGADLFDSHLTFVAESVGKCGAREAHEHEHSNQKQALPAGMPEKVWSLLSGLN